MGGARRITYGCEENNVAYGEITPIILSGVLGLLMAFIAYGPDGPDADLLNGGPSQKG